MPIDDALYSSASPEWTTPTRILDPLERVYGLMDLDPCSEAPSFLASEIYNVSARIHYHLKGGEGTSQPPKNGLFEPWFGKVFMNPPYGRTIKVWIQRAVDAYRNGDIEYCIALVPARTDTTWWGICKQFPVCFIEKRLKFGGADNSAPFPSALINIGGGNGYFLEAFQELGPIYHRMSDDKHPYKPTIPVSSDVHPLNPAGPTQVFALPPHPNIVTAWVAEDVAIHPEVEVTVDSMTAAATVDITPELERMNEKQAYRIQDMERMAIVPHPSHGYIEQSVGLGETAMQCRCGGRPYDSSATLPCPGEQFPDWMGPARAQLHQVARNTRSDDQAAASTIAESRNPQVTTEWVRDTSNDPEVSCGS